MKESLITFIFRALITTVLIILLSSCSDEYEIQERYIVDSKLQIVLDRFLEDAERNDYKILIPRDFTLIFSDNIPGGKGAETLTRTSTKEWSEIRISTKYEQFSVTNMVLERIVYHELVHAIMKQRHHSADPRNIMYPNVEDFDWLYYRLNRDEAISELFQ